MVTKAATKKATPVTVEVEMVLERVTKNTYRFAAADDESVIDTLYVHKSAFNGTTVDEDTTIKVTVEVA